MMMAGQECDLAEKTKEIKELLKGLKIFSHRGHIQPSGEFEVGAMPLSEDCSLLKSIVLARIDLDEQTFDARYVYEDWGQSYHGSTDDVSAFIDSSGNFINIDAEEHVKKMPDKMNEYQALFELCKTCLFLPDYFEAFSDDVRVERHPTEFTKFRKKHKNKKAVSCVSKAHRIPYRQPFVLIRDTRRSPNRAEFITPDINVETSGFWKNLPIGTQGKDKNGNPITGRTWVCKTLSWSEESESNGKLSVERKCGITPLKNAGYIYPESVTSNVQNCAQSLQ